MIRLADAEATTALGRRIAAALRVGDVIALSGNLGAGKTTLARGILLGLGFEGEVASPTFPIVLPYDSLAVPVWHVDLYRIESERELEELGLDDALGDGALLIEWPERLGARLWRHSLNLALAPHPDGGRALTAGVPEAWEGRWPPR